MKILVVDDEVLALNILEIALREAGYNDVDYVQSSADALNYLESAATPYECLLLDIDMPEMTGIELCRHARQMEVYSSVPIIMISALTNPKTMESAFSAGATDYVNKPFNGLELGTRLRAANLLSQATNKSRREAHPVTQEFRTENSLDVLFSDSFSLVPLPGLISQTDFLCATMEHDRLPEGLRFFSAAIADAERIFYAVPNSEYRSFINDIARSLISIAHSWSPRITYTGYGVFWVALFDVGSLSAKGLHNILNAGFGAKAVDSLPSYRGDLRLCCQHLRTANREDFQSTNALHRLLHADRLAKGMASARFETERTNDLRDQFLGQGKTPCLTRCEIVLPTSAPKHIQPKRVAPRISAKADTPSVPETVLVDDSKSESK